MSKWIKNTSGESRYFLTVSLDNNATYLIPTTQEVKFAAHSDILLWVANGDAQMSEDGTTYQAHAPTGLKILTGYGQPKDSDGVAMVRTKMFSTGVAARFHFLSFKTSDLTNKECHKKSDGITDYGWTTYKLYDTNGDEITDAANQADATRTVVDWEPPNINFEITGGKFYQDAIPTTDILLWVVGVPDLTEAQGGSFNFITSANLKLMDSGLAFEVDGRVAMTMKYDATYHTNKLRFIFEHDAGVQHHHMAQIEAAY